MRILVTGANGFLGSSFVRYIYETEDILAISRNGDKLPNENIKFISSDILNYKNTHGDIINFSPDIVVLFAWNNGNKYSDINKSDQFTSNVPGYIDFIRFLCGLPKKPHIFGIGSFAEYGNLVIPALEDTTENPFSLYGMSKLILKKYSELYCQMNDALWTWVRPCFIYGPNDIETRFIPKVIKKCINNEDFELNSCNSVSDYLYIDDFVEYLYLLILTGQTGVFNICSNNGYLSMDIVKLIHDMTESSSQITFNEKLDTGNNTFVCGINKKISQVTNKYINLSLETGIIKTIKHYQWK